MEKAQIRAIKCLPQIITTHKQKRQLANQGHTDSNAHMWCVDYLPEWPCVNEILYGAELRTNRSPETHCWFLKLDFLFCDRVRQVRQRLRDMLCYFSKRFCLFIATFVNKYRYIYTYAHQDTCITYLSLLTSTKTGTDLNKMVEVCPKPCAPHSDKWVYCYHGDCSQDYSCKGQR